jgi:ABC-type hemin transport system substrate-binding protein
MRGVFLLLLSVLLVVTGACSRESPAASASKQNRVVVLSPALAVIVRDLGYADTVVARHAYDDVLPKELPAVGDQAGIDYEALLRVKPTHVLVQWGSRELPERLTQLATQNQWQITNLNPLQIEDIFLAVHRIDATLRKGNEPSLRCSELLNQIAEFRSAPKAAAWGPVLLLASTNPPAALGPGSCHDELLRAVGGQPAISEGKPWIELSPEDLVRLQPRAILLIRPRSARGVTDADVPTTDPWEPLAKLQLQALQTGSFAVIDDPEGLLPSTSMIRVGEAMRKHLEAWRK